MVRVKIGTVTMVISASKHDGRKQSYSSQVWNEQWRQQW